MKEIGVGYGLIDNKGSLLKHEIFKKHPIIWVLKKFALSKKRDMKLKNYKAVKLMLFYKKI